VAAQKAREDEEKQMTLEEYRKKQAESKRQTEVQRRAAGEGVDDSQWKNTVVLKKEEEIDVCRPCTAGWSAVEILGRYSMLPAFPMICNR
jgi:hypothetical protein